MAPTRSLTIRLLAALVNTKMQTSFLGHHMSATFELRAGVVEGPQARTAGRSVARALTRRAQIDADDAMAKQPALCICVLEVECEPRATAA